MNTGTSMNPYISPLGWAVLVVILFSQSLWLYHDARKRNAKRWFWGLYGLIQFPCPTLLYLIFVRKVFRRKDKIK